MTIVILSFEVPRSIPEKKKFLKSKIEYYKISLEYNIDEDRFYYNDGEKNIPTKKDLSRSILIIYDIFKRYEKFGFKERFKLKEDNLKWFLETFTDGNNNETDLYYQHMLFGSKPINLMTLNYACKQLKIAQDISFEDYFNFEMDIY